MAKKAAKVPRPITPVQQQSINRRVAGYRQALIDKARGLPPRPNNGMPPPKR